MKQDTKIVPNSTPVDELVDAGVEGLLLSGGAPRVGLDGTLGNCGEMLDRLEVPILGICAGHQFMARHFGGEAAPGNPPEFGEVAMQVVVPGGILEGVAPVSTVWASHHDEVSVVPDCFDVLARSETCPVQIMAHKERPLFGMQFHPEVEHTEGGVTMLRNFVAMCKPIVA